MRHPVPRDSATVRRMREQRRGDTRPERVVRREVTALGYRCRVARKGLPGSPDLSNASRGWAIFVHGCFWHQHPGCSHATLPKHNREWWRAKFEANGR